MTSPEPSDVDALAAALRADTADLEVYARVVTTSLADALPAGMVDVERDRSLSDRVAGRPGRVSLIRIAAGEWQLTLAPARRGAVTAHAERVVRGVAISSREVGLDEWTRLLADALADRARESSAARAALQRLLGA